MITSRQLRRYEQLKKAAIDAEKALDRYEAKLRPLCQHPEQYVRDWEWEHDNGYGRQHKVVGLRCSICGATKSWKDSRNWTT